MNLSDEYTIWKHVPDSLLFHLIISSKENINENVAVSLYNLGKIYETVTNNNNRFYKLLDQMAHPSHLHIQAPCLSERSALYIIIACISQNKLLLAS